MDIVKKTLAEVYLGILEAMRMRWLKLVGYDDDAIDYWLTKTIEEFKEVIKEESGEE